MHAFKLAIVAFMLMSSDGGACVNNASAQESESKPVAGNTDKRLVDSSDSGQAIESTEEQVFFTDGLLPIGQHSLTRDDLDLISAIRMVGGEHVEKQGRFATIIRLKQDAKQVVLRCDLRNARNNPSANPLIQSGDVILLDSRAPETDLTGPNERRVRYRRLPVIGPTTKGGSPVAGDPPTDGEILRAMKKVDPTSEVLAEMLRRTDLKIIKEKIADYIDPPRVYPLIGAASLHHAHYKCTVHFSGINDDVADREVVYIDHNHFHMIDSKNR